MEQNGWDEFFHTGKVEDYLRYRGAENKAAEALEAVGLARPVLPDDAKDGLSTGMAKPVLPVDAERRNADQDGRASP